MIMRAMLASRKIRSIKNFSQRQNMNIIPHITPSYSIITWHANKRNILADSTSKPHSPHSGQPALPAPAGPSCAWPCQKPTASARIYLPILALQSPPFPPDHPYPLDVTKSTAWPMGTPAWLDPP
ncbi:hypothetical protein BJ508DRAFT_137681 [Ascobolus immersus RN42]|uniref:Uncharacterized protein n=1 Tax=Ascobolus immersus RN42 TaxID=1160509 RepID=A0A3N4I0U2_ASCIM|nr:hypothetical protein BJ508DRAFT_137681 [Ascobolus immersus RN42]